jgi:hypothetical protein
MWVNAERLEDYNGRALAIKKDEIITSYYANGRTFKELLSFIGEEGRKEKTDIDIIDNISDSAEQNAAVQEKQKTDIPLSDVPEQTTVLASPAEQLPQPTQTIITETSSGSEAVSMQAETPAPPALPEIKTEVSVYRLSAKKAEEYGVMDIYDLSRRMDIDCAEAITKSIQAHKKGNNSYDLATSADTLNKKYGKERMAWVLSKHILSMPIKFSNKNLLWAKACITEETGSGDESPTFSISTHHAVLDAFVNKFRAILNKKSSFSEKMKDAKKKSEAHNNPNA